MTAAIAAMAMTPPRQATRFLAGLFLPGLFLAGLILAGPFLADLPLPARSVSGQPNGGSCHRKCGSGSAPDGGSPLLSALNIANFAASVASFARPFLIPASRRRSRHRPRRPRRGRMMRSGKAMSAPPL
jgi:hypothetical protein